MSNATKKIGENVDAIRAILANQGEFNISLRDVRRGNNIFVVRRDDLIKATSQRSGSVFEEKCRADENGIADVLEFVGSELAKWQSPTN